MGEKMQEITGICKYCLGCSKLEIPSFHGVNRCEFATEEQISLFVEEMRKKRKEVKKA